MYDPRNLNRFSRFGEVALEAFRMFAALDAGVIPHKHTQLMATVAAPTTQCPYGIDIRARNCRRRCDRARVSPRPRWWPLPSAPAGPRPTGRMPSRSRLGSCRRAKAIRPLSSVTYAQAADAGIKRSRRRVSRRRCGRDGHPPDSKSLNW